VAKNLGMAQSNPDFSLIMVGDPSGYDKQFAMERSTIFKFGKPSISMDHFPWRTVQ